MRKNLYNSIAYLLLVALLGCGVKFGRYSEVDLEDQKEAPSTDVIAFVKRIKNAGKIDFVAPIIYDNNLSNQWGFDKTNCADFYETTEIKRLGVASLSLEWTSGSCPWIGMGRAWNNGKTMDFSSIIDKAAIQLYIRSQNGNVPLPKISISLEDINKKNKAVSIQLAYIEGNQLTTDWQKVLIPLNEFGFSSSEVDITKMYQIIFAFEGKGALYMDDIELVEFSGNTSNPFNKSKDELNLITKSDLVKLPFSIYDNDLNSNWGFEVKENKEVRNQSDVSYKGNQSIYWSWDYSKAPDWVGWGMAFKEDNVLMNFTNSDSMALEFYIRTEKKNVSELPVMVGLEDNAARSSYVSLDNRYIMENQFTDKWQQVIIPIADFGLSGKGLNPENMKQLILYAEMFSPIKKGALYFDNFRLVKYLGIPGNPFNKDRYNLFVPDDKIITENNEGTEGVFVGGFLTNNPRGTGVSFGRLIGRKPSCVMWYTDWFNEINTEEVQGIIDNGYTPHIVWEAMRMNTRDGITLNDIIEGKWDEYIERTALKFKGVNGVVQLRLFHEFNGDWYPWCVSVNNRSPETYIKAWRHVVDIFKKHEVTNVQWSWCFNKLAGVPNKDAEWNQPHLAYPGDDYVDWVSVDFYNYFPVYDEIWYSFKEHFTPDYIYMARHWPTKPIQIGEFASNKTGGDKAAWFLEMNEDIKKFFPRLKNYNYFEINKEADWRLAATPESQRAFQTIMKDSYNRSSSLGLNNVIENYAASIQKEDDIIVLEREVNESNLKRRLRLKEFVENKKQAKVSKLATPIIVDGILSETSIYSSTSIDIEGSQIYLNYDAEYFYISGNIKDKDPLLNNFDDGMIWNGDVIEFSFGANPNADLYREKYDPTDYHIGAKVHQKGYIWNWNANSRENTSAIFKETAFGYFFEMKISIKSLGLNEIVRNTPYGFELAISNGNSSSRQKQLFWNSKEEGFHQKPYLWGSLIFE